jgi:hypothetical protein
MGKPPTPKPASKATLSQFMPWEIGDPVPPWLRDHLDINVIKELGAAQIRTQRQILEVRLKAAQEMEKLVTKR